MTDYLLLVPEYFPNFVSVLTTTKMLVNQFFSKSRSDLMSQGSLQHAPGIPPQRAREHNICDFDALKS